MNDWNADDLVAVDKRYLQHENTVPDIMILAKALTGRYIPLVITLLAEYIFWKFSDEEAKRDAKLGAAVCFAARRHGLLTRPIGNVIVPDATFLHYAISVAPGRPSHRVRDRGGLWRKRARLKW